MFIILLTVTFFISLVVSVLVAWFFDTPIKKILGSILDPEISLAWSKYLKFAIYVVGVSNGVNLWSLEKYVNPTKDSDGVILTWMLLVFFLFSLIAYVIVKVFGKTKKE